MMAQFMMDLKTDPRTSPSLYHPNSPKMHESYRPNSTDSGVLDLSKRRDSMETRKTPSPYNSFSEGGSPPLHSSPINPSSGLLLNYHAMQHQHQAFPAKVTLPYEPSSHLELRHSAPAEFHPTQAFHMAHPIIPKQEHIQQRPELASYLLQSGALQHQQFHRSPPTRNREVDSLSESGSEGHSAASNMKQVPMKQSNESNNGPYPMVIGRDGKLARPFKAYPRDPLSLASGFMTTDSILDNNSAEKYSLFRKRMLNQIHAANGGQPTVSNPKMRRLNKSLSDASETESVSEKMSDASERPQHHQQQQHQKTIATPLECSNPSEAVNSDECNSNGATGMVRDSAYYERRKKNNAAAKKSRDRRRIKEDEIAIRAAFLERENIELKFELAAARKQLALYGVATASS
ncbi:protein giant [Toxorhynchites rutilus septentrionalis]|uniref:protein giant n=1 Tax=Toxorhynchites rutilus septentrionalis TaxID=329112 RepID=UPI0024786AB8|nr:protein giant [Toxorhynchites rutilus septentrionalis]